MSEKVYLLGAGANQSIRDLDNLPPPMTKNFFQISLKKGKYANEHYIEKAQSVYDYIEKYWRKNKSDLATSSFDLEECFTLLERQARQAQQRNDEQRYRELWKIQFLLKSFFAEVLSEFETFAYTSETMQKFGKLLYKERPTILTFNYDCFVEAVIEGVSGVNPSLPEEMFKPPPDKWPFERIKVSDEELAYSHFNWNRPLGYGLIFDEVQLHRAGLSTYVEGKRFYSHCQNKLYSWPILKLHGSLNWFRYLPIRKYPIFSEDNTEISKFTKKANEIILVDAKFRWWFAEPPDLDGWIIDPLVITPTLYKDAFYRERPFNQVWKMAEDALSRCKRLIVIGYSFSPTDFATKQLFLESFSNHDIDELIVVNPNTSVVQVTKGLCHHDKPVVVCKNLKEYLVKYGV